MHRPSHSPHSSCAPGPFHRHAPPLPTSFLVEVLCVIALCLCAGGAAPLLNAYAHAVENKYRFLSFGDACLLFNVASQRSTGPAAPSSPSLHSGTGGPSAQGPGLSGGGMQASGDMVPDIVEAASGYGPRTAAAAATAKSSATVDPQGKVLLHSCCAPCSGAMIEEMQQQVWGLWPSWM